MLKKRDPVCQAKVNKKTEYTFRYNGKKYYFDSASCLLTFKSESHKFVKSKQSGLLDWLGKNSKDVPKSCH